MKVVQLTLSVWDESGFLLLDYVEDLKGMNLNPNCEANALQ